MTLADSFRQCLIDLDTDGIIRLWKYVFPSDLVPNKQQALVSIHMGRTVAVSLPLKLRAYSHRWLLDSGYPSQLPDELKSRAERLYPKHVGSVGISVNSKYPVVQNAIRGAMENAVLETYADGYSEKPEVVKKRMQEARMKERKGLML